MAWHGISSTEDEEKKSLDFAAKQSNQEQLRSIMGRKRRKLNSPQRGTKQRERLSQIER
jgi:hypothetical protein